MMLALIVPLGDLGGNRPDNSLPQPPLGIWGGAGQPMPMPPIAMPPVVWPQPPGGGLPPHVWPRPPVDPGYGVPAPPPGVNVPVFPAHPIFIPDEGGEGGGGGEGGMVTNPIYTGGMVLVWIRGTGWALVPIGGSGDPIATGGGPDRVPRRDRPRPDQGLPPYAQPKT